MTYPGTCNEFLSTSSKIPNSDMGMKEEWTLVLISVVFNPSNHGSWFKEPLGQGYNSDFSFFGALSKLVGSKGTSYNRVITSVSIRDLTPNSGFRSLSSSFFSFFFSNSIHHVSHIKTTTSSTFKNFYCNNPSSTTQTFPFSCLVFDLFLSCVQKKGKNIQKKKKKK